MKLMLFKNALCNNEPVLVNPEHVAAVVPASESLKGSVGCVVILTTGITYSLIESLHYVVLELTNDIVLYETLLQIEIDLN